MIRFSDVTFTYHGADRPALGHVDLHVPEGELCAVIGTTGSGKSTLLRAVNGLVPHFTGGHLQGRVEVDGRSTAEHPPRELADVVGYVGQDPASGFVTDLVEDELAYAMENLGIDPQAMRRRVEDTLDLLGLHDLRTRSVRSLSGGQCQRVAIGAVLTASPRVLVLDEPTSALDPAAAEEVLAALARLVHDLGITVLVAEHRLERVLPFADRLVTLDGTGRVGDGDPRTVMQDFAVAPPIVELGRLAGWSPLPLSVRDARRVAAPLRARLAGTAPGGTGPPRVPASGDAPAATVRGLSARYGPVVALRHLDLDIPPSTVTALMGRNGSGKSTLLHHLAGVQRPDRGTVLVGGQAPASLPSRRLIRHVALVPQDPGVLLCAETVAGECAAADRDGDLAAGTTAATLDRILGGLPADRHPRDLSEGQRLSLALAVVLAPSPPLVLLDEPTRGLDYGGKRHLGRLLGELAAGGHAIMLATHDVELVAAVADRAVVLAAGEVVADGPARDVVCHSPVFAPQVAKVLSPASWLTVDEVRRALEAEAVAT